MPGVADGSQREPTHAVRDAALLLMATLAAHGLLLVNRGVFWDDWPLVELFAAGRLDQVRDKFFEIRAPINALVHGTLGGLAQPVLAYRVLALLAIWAGGVASVAALRRVSCLSARERLAVGLLAVGFPSGAAAASLIVVPYLVHVALFWLGWWLLLGSEGKAGAARVAWATLGTIAALLSFFLSSLLVFHLAGIAALVARRVHGGRSVREAVTWLIRRRPHVIAIAPAFWLVANLVAPLGGKVADYNTLWPSTRDVASAAWHSVRSVLAGIAGAAWWLGALAAVLAGVIAAVVAARTAARDQAARPEWRWRLAAVGALLAVLAAVPYVVVGKPLSLVGIDARNALLLPIPLGLILVGLARALSRRVARAAVIAAAVTLLGAASVRAHLGWHARAERDAAIIAALARTPEGARYQIFIIDDRAPAGPQPFRFHWEWAGMLHAAYGGGPRIGFELSGYTPAWIRNAIAIPDWISPPRWTAAGCVARLTIEPGPELRLACAPMPERPSCPCPR